MQYEPVFDFAEDDFNFEPSDEPIDTKLRKQSSLSVTVLKDKKRRLSLPIERKESNQQLDLPDKRLSRSQSVKKREMNPPHKDKDKKK